jgi:hypothetical protein
MRQCDIHQGMRPAKVPGAMNRKTALPRIGKNRRHMLAP